MPIFKKVTLKNLNHHHFFSFFYPDFNEDRLADIIHRGRDHGLPTYKQVREFCGLSPISTFQELNTTMDSRVILNLQHTYKVRIAETLMEYFLMHEMIDLRKLVQKRTHFSHLEQPLMYHPWHQNKQSTLRTRNGNFAKVINFIVIANF